MIGMDRLSGMRVLVVEDESMVAMIVEEFLEDLGCQVVATASRLDEALDKASNVALDAAVLDINLAGRLSYPVAQLLHDRHVPFIFATGYDALALPQALRSVPVLAKPFRQTQLAEALLRAEAAGAGHSSVD